MSYKAKVSNVDEKNGTLTFTLSNVNVSYANGLRRIIISDIPIIAIESSPYDKNNVSILVNKSRLNNELIKQRLSSIPIFISRFSNKMFYTNIIHI